MTNETTAPSLGDQGTWGKMKGWHWMRDDMTLRYDDGRKPAIGEWLAAEGDIELCINGMHASKLALDALQYAPGSLCCRVELRGEIKYCDDKMVARERRILWAVDCSAILPRFARRCALDVADQWDCPPMMMHFLRTGEGAIEAWSAWSVWSSLAARAAESAAARAARAETLRAAWSVERQARAVPSARAAAQSARAAGASGAKQNRRLTAMISEAR